MVRRYPQGLCCSLIWPAAALPLNTESTSNIFVPISHLGKTTWANRVEKYRKCRLLFTLLFLIKLCFYSQTFVNDVRIQEQIYVTLKIDDKLRFGYDIL